MPEALPQMPPDLLSARGVVTDLGGGGNILSGRRAQVRAVDRVDLDIAAGEIFGLVSGQDPRMARRTRAAVQYVHQDPGAALDPW